MLNNFFSKIYYYLFNITGRANRTEYFIYSIIYALTTIVIYRLIDNIDLYNRSILNWPYALVLHILITTPTMAATTRRLKDANLSLHWFLLYLIPVVKYFLIIYLCIKKTSVNNKTIATDRERILYKD
ncbi:MULTISPECIES: DUF805 domain-containing protein [Myroides]|uniref:DUF805 domain-containing protein n=1 Tax=Myroides albus TaxID=2562892 RepID=A0A6I3LKX1_9FLAO|nr:MULTISPECIES: DUF805 domain-containing protein [Myroides]MTG98357.1 DUF805 domain-containing protein [Myroides albus]MVX35708.1 DUF805 domain-containing protein [Myroides sp. LoEW2-1]UVD80351.1 DUF805 domain-containing protein [Myroides albus]